MPFADPKWLEILKASGGQSAALALACAGFLILDHSGVFPALPTWVDPLATFALLLSAFLALAALFSALNKSFGLRDWVVYRVGIRHAQKAVRDYIPHMTVKEREIIGYLLANNQKQFTADQDGGYAAGLMARRIIVLAGQRGQTFRQSNAPMCIPDHVWNVLKQHQEKFPYEPPRPGEVRPQPWRVPWGL